MASGFDRWEKDPFFPAAEEVQDSADRMESIYRSWLHHRKAGDSEEFRTEVQTALGTAKWQLEEFQRAVKSCPQEAARARHRQFVVAIGEMITRTEQSLKELALKDGRQELSWVRLDEGERNELALFLEGSPSKEAEEGSSGNSVGDSSTKGLIPRLVEVDVLSAGKEKVNHNGHRRTASAADADSWKITMGCDGEPHLPPPRIPSFSGFVGVAESATKLKWPKNGFRKWKVGGDRHQAADSEPLRANRLSRGIKDCYERSKSCLDGCDDESYDKQLYGWIGTLQRQLQRSQYHFQYSRSMQIFIWTVLIIFLFVLIALHAI